MVHNEGHTVNSGGNLLNKIIKSKCINKSVTNNPHNGILSYEHNGNPTTITPCYIRHQPYQALISIFDLKKQVIAYLPLLGINSIFLVCYSGASHIQQLLLLHCIMFLDIHSSNRITDRPSLCFTINLYYKTHIKYTNMKQFTLNHAPWIYGLKVYSVQPPYMKDCEQKIWLPERLIGDELLSSWNTLKTMLSKNTMQNTRSTINTLIYYITLYVWEGHETVIRDKLIHTSSCMSLIFC